MATRFDGQSERQHRGSREGWVLAGLLLTIWLVAVMGAAPAAAQDIEWGDNGSEWANDGECDDPRFAGPGVADELIDADRFHDANDCRTLYESGQVYLRSEQGTERRGNLEIDFGDNASQWANDGECDDPRFGGPGMADELVAEDLGHDANDCRDLYDAGQVYLKQGDLSDPTERVEYDGIDFGDNTSEWANDQECDDPRFAGEGMAETLVEEDLGHDANDCKALYEEGKIRLRTSSA